LTWPLTISRSRQFQQSQSGPVKLQACRYRVPGKQPVEVLFPLAKLLLIDIKDCEMLVSDVADPDI
jgi:hypothetical protein